MRRLVTRLAMVVATAGALAAVLPATGALGDRPVSSPVGTFVVGDGSAVPAASVEFWGAQWAKDNVVSGGMAPDSFKGWAVTVVPTSPCGGTFTTAPGDSSDPPADVPAGSVIDVLVTDDVTKDGPVISGTYVDVHAVQVDPGYGPAPGHAGTGTDLGSICNSSGGH